MNTQRLSESKNYEKYLKRSKNKLYNKKIKLKLIAIIRYY